jgi:methionyl-tRNA formyltransferase
MVDVVAAIDSGTTELVAQAREGASFQGLVDDEVARLDFSADAQKLDRRVRGCDPQPGAWAELAGERVRLYGSVLEAGAAIDQPPGTVLAVDDAGLKLAAKGGVLRIQKIWRGSAAKKCVAAESGFRSGDQLD